MGLLDSKTRFWKMTPHAYFEGVQVAMASLGLTLVLHASLFWNSPAGRSVVSSSESRSSGLENEGTQPPKFLWHKDTDGGGSKPETRDQSWQKLQTWWNFQSFPFCEVMDNLKSTGFYFCLFLCWQPRLSANLSKMSWCNYFNRHCMLLYLGDINLSKQKEC